MMCRKVSKTFCSGSSPDIPAINLSSWAKKGGKKVVIYYVGAVVYLLGIPLFAGIEMDAPWIKPGIWRIGARTVMGLLWPVFLVGWALYEVFFVGPNEGLHFRKE